MGLDYYSVLEVTRSVDEHDLVKAFHRTALRYHPHTKPLNYRTQELDFQTTNKMLTLVCEAFDILSTPLLRAIYDQFGEEGLKNGAPLTNDSQLYYLPYCYHGNALETFRQVFGDEFPYLAPPKYNQEVQMSKVINNKFKASPLKLTLPLSLEEVFKGAAKEVLFTRWEMDAATDLFLQKEHRITVKVPPGVYNGTMYNFPRQGNQARNSIPGDVVVVTEDLPHPLFLRSGQNIITTQVVTLKAALLGTELNIPMLDDRTLRVRVTDVISPHYELKIQGEGLPFLCKDILPEEVASANLEEPTSGAYPSVNQPPDVINGDLLLRFRLNFPRNISTAIRKPLLFALDKLPTFVWEDK